MCRYHLLTSTERPEWYNQTTASPSESDTDEDSDAATRAPYVPPLAVGTRAPPRDTLAALQQQSPERERSKRRRCVVCQLYDCPGSNNRERCTQAHAQQAREPTPTPSPPRKVPNTAGEQVHYWRASEPTVLQTAPQASNTPHSQPPEQHPHAQSRTHHSTHLGMGTQQQPDAAHAPTRAPVMPVAGHVPTQSQYYTRPLLMPGAPLPAMYSRSPSPHVRTPTPPPVPIYTDPHVLYTSSMYAVGNTTLQSSLRSMPSYRGRGRRSSTPSAQGRGRGRGGTRENL